MKKLYTLIASVVITLTVFAQAPSKMSYQAVVRDAADALVTSQAVGMQLSIVQGSVSGTVVYVETQTPTSNLNGLVSVEIGSGTVVSGTFNSIDWSSGPYFIKTETDPTGGTTYTITGTSELMSVPYALHANTADSIVGGIAGRAYSIGVWPELGGYVFWVSPGGNHGLVSEIQDQGLTNWYGAQDAISNPAKHSLDAQKFRDWRLPTKHELNEMYSANAAIGSFGTKTYWSSTRSGSTTAWRQNLSSGIQFNNTAFTISALFFVRSVREF
jgi:hypothetical protein